MKKGINIFKILALIIILGIFGCSTPPPPKINYFNADRDKIFVGEEVELKWSVEGAKSVTVSNIESNLPVNGTYKVSPKESTYYVLKANYEGNIETKLQLQIEVSQRPKVILEEKPKTEPIIEKINQSQSNYFKGTINYENVSDKTKIKSRIFALEHNKFPKEVKLYVNVFDNNGNKVANLAPPYNKYMKSFWKSLNDSCKDNESISEFNVIEKRENDLAPLSISFVLDFSGSMIGSIKLLEEAYSKCSDYIRPNDDYSTVQFSSFVFPIIPQTSDKSKMNNIIPFEKIAGATAFYSASMVGLDNIKKSEKQKIAILMTDGMDNASFLDSKLDVINSARQSNTKIFIVALTGMYFTNQKDLIDIAEQTGGMYYSISDANDLDDIYSEIFQSLRVYYEITYKSNDCGENKHVAKLTTQPSENYNNTSKKPYFLKPDIINNERMFIACNFENRSSFIDTLADLQYKRLANYMNNNPTNKLEIYGHTSSQGSEALNLNLSKKRAEAFKNKLISSKIGLKKKYISKVEGKGESELIYNPDDFDWQQLENRRVVIKIK